MSTSLTPLPRSSAAAARPYGSAAVELTEPPSRGAVKATVGAVLSTSTVWAGEGALLPARSVTTTRTANEPSRSAFVFHAAGVNWKVPAGRSRYSNCFEATPDDASVDESVRLTVALTFAPGSSRIAFGGVLSTQRFVTGVDCATLPALSVATTRKSWSPSS